MYMYMYDGGVCILYDFNAVYIIYACMLLVILVPRNPVFVGG